MSVHAIKPGYHGQYRDGVEHFNGKQLLNICWDKHTMLGWPMCIPIDPELTFGQLIDLVMPAIFSIHPDFTRIEWDKVQWFNREGPSIPDRNKSLSAHGLRHKSKIRFRTPGLNGHNGGG